MERTMTLYLMTSREEQLLDAMLLEARGYAVKTVVDAHKALDECGHKPTARNLRWAVSHVVLQCHFCVLHRDMDAADMVAAVDHARHLGAYALHQDEVPFSPLLLGQEHLDAHDLCGDALRAPERIGQALKRAVGALWQRTVAFEQRMNALLGDGLKNPMVREQRKEYPAPGPVSTTG